MALLITLGGVLLLFALFYDVYATVFVAHGPAGPISRRLYAWSWWATRRWAGAGHSPRARKRLARLGPLLIPLTVLVWAALLVLAFTLINLPSANDFLVGGKQVLPAWFKALYVSGYSITTLGVGDVAPSGMPLRLVMVVAAASGFILITVAVTYLLAVYSALDRVTALAFEIHRFMGRSDGLAPADALVVAVQSESTGELSSWLASIASSLAQVVEAEDEFQLLHYFHMSTNERSLALALTDLLELVTLCRGVISPAHFPVLANGFVVRGTERTAHGYYEAFSARLRHAHVNEERLTRARKAAFEQAWTALADAGVPLRAHDDAWARYQAARARWDRQSSALREELGYPAFDAWATPTKGRERPAPQNFK